MKKLYVVDLEYIESRYTAQWKSFVPAYLTDKLIDSHEVVVIEGGDVPQMTSPGAFLNFGGTTVYKANQIEKIGRMICDGAVKDGDEFLFTDFWHPGILFLKYMSSLMGIHIKTHGLIHAGSYDPQDFLGRLDDKVWCRKTEEAMFAAFDHVYFATEFHVDLFGKTFFNQFTFKEEKAHLMRHGKIRIIGWPFDFMKEKIENDIKGIEKKDQVVFPHRIAPEKQLWTIDILRKELPEINFVVCQEMNLTKEEYHRVLGESKVVWSASLQETYGISTCVEGPLAGCIPFAPNSLSYAEIFEGRPFLYNSSFISSKHSFEHSIEYFKFMLRDMMKNYDGWKVSLENYTKGRLPEISSFSGFVEYIKADNS